MLKRLFLAGIFLWQFIGFSQDMYTVNTKQVKSSVPSTLWGLFFEDINRAADGGVYAEMVENGSFDFPKPMTAWTTWPQERLRDGIFLVTNQMATNIADPKYMSVTLREGDTVGLINSGFDEGMYFEKGESYRLTIRYRKQAGDIHSRAFLFDGKGRFVARADAGLLDEQRTPGPGKDSGWMEKEIIVTPTDSTTRGKLLVIFEGKGKVDIDRISLFPTDTWKNIPGGLRADLVQKLATLHPGFLRFPGGCIVEGNQLVHRYQWKNTIGPLEDRLMVQSIWADDVPQRQTPDYMESFGLGFYEYFHLCEDIGAQPLPIINAGMSCQFDAAEVVPLSQLRPFIQDALDLIEFANGDTTTVWGRKRAQLGHPRSFHMTMLGVGNENWGPQYAERLDLFTKAIKAKYPEIKIVCATGYSRNIPVFTYMDSVNRTRHYDIQDEHFYDTPEWFIDNATRYDHYDRTGPKVFVGEYAAQSDRIGSMKNMNNLRTALAEACFMTGIERNADIVCMASYAPLFAHVTGWQWTPNLIWFDNRTSYATPNYWVQWLFSNNKGTAVVQILKEGKPLTGQDSCWASTVIDQNSHELIIKLVNMSAEEKQKDIRLSGARVNRMAAISCLSNTDLNIQNSISQPDNIRPQTRTFPVKGKAIYFTAAPYSLNVIRVKLK